VSVDCIVVIQQMFNMSLRSIHQRRSVEREGGCEPMWTIAEGVGGRPSTGSLKTRVFLRFEVCIVV